jgi:hypothetical protein
LLYRLSYPGYEEHKGRQRKIKSDVNTTQRRKGWREGDRIKITKSERKGKRITGESEREIGILRRRSHNRGN